MPAPVDRPGRAGWTSWAAAEDPAERLVAADVFAGHVVLELRPCGGRRLRSCRGDRPRRRHQRRRSTPSVAPAASASELGTQRGVRRRARCGSSSSPYTEPPRWYDVDLATGEPHPAQAPRRPRLRRGRATSRSGTPCPAADGDAGPGHPGPPRRHAARRHGALPALGATAPTSRATSPEFDPALPSACSTAASSSPTPTSVAAASAAGTGGSTATWPASSNTFSDFVAAADAWPPTAGRRAPDRLPRPVGRRPAAGRGRSRRRRDRWAAVVAEVPFVDVVTTMLDESVPLTAQEWDEWGDPRRPEDFAWMLRLLPVRQPAGRRRPAAPARHRRASTTRGSCTGSRPSGWPASRDDRLTRRPPAVPDRARRRRPRRAVRPLRPPALRGRGLRLGPGQARRDGTSCWLRCPSASEGLETR